MGLETLRCWFYYHSGDEANRSLLSARQFIGHSSQGKGVPSHGRGGEWRGDLGWGPGAEGTRKDGDKRLDVVSGGGNRHRKFRIKSFE